MQRDEELRAERLEDRVYEYCLRCGRKLKSGEARKQGYGKICLEKMRKTTKTKKLF